MKQNPERKSSIIWLAVAAVGAIIVFLPAILGIEGMDGGFALGTLGFLIIITGIVGAIVYAWRAKKLDAMLGGKDLLVHWTYSLDEWQRYTERAHQDKKSTNKTLFFIIAGFALPIGIVFLIGDPENGKFMFLVMLGLIALMGILAYATAMLDYRRNRKNLGEAYIARNGVYLNGELHTWKGLATRLDTVTYEEEADSLVFTYIALDRVGPHPYTVRVPVPQGQEAKARELLAQLRHSR